jgi:hypothetical protein
LTPEERRQRFLDLARANESAARGVLPQAKLDRLQQIDWQMRGAWAFQDAKVVEALTLTAAQRERIRAIHAEAFFASLAGGPGEPGPRERPLRLSPAVMDKIKAQLTAEQVRLWHDLVGAEFKGPMGFHPGRGHFGPRP